VSAILTKGTASDANNKARHRCAFVMEFPALPDIPGITFSVAVNDQPLLPVTPPRKAAFRSF